MDCNHLPGVRDTDESIWRRLVVVPFRRVVPEQKRDRSLPKQLRAEAEGILAWMVSGLKNWLERGGVAAMEKERKWSNKKASRLGSRPPDS